MSVAYVSCLKYLFSPAFRLPGFQRYFRFTVSSDLFLWFRDLSLSDVPCTVDSAKLRKTWSTKEIFIIDCLTRTGVLKI